MFILNNMKTTTKINQKSRERERPRPRERERENDFMPLSNCLVCHSMAKRPPDWAMKSWTALNINEFILFGREWGASPLFRLRHIYYPVQFLCIPEFWSVYMKYMCTCSISRISPSWARAGYKKTLSTPLPS